MLVKRSGGGLMDGYQRLATPSAHSRRRTRATAIGISWFQTDGFPLRRLHSSADHHPSPGRMALLKATPPTSRFHSLRIDSPNRRADPKRRWACLCLPQQQPPRRLPSRKRYVLFS